MSLDQRILNNEKSQFYQCGKFKAISSFLFILLIYSEDLSAIQLDYWSSEISVSSTKQNLEKNEALNPGNQYLSLPESSLNLNFRPDLRLHSFENQSLTARPLLEVKQSQLKIDNSSETKYTNKFKWNEIFINQILSETTQMTYGLQSYQWGPAEASSPSNFIYNDTIVDKDSLYVARGLHLIRFNFSPTQSLSEIFMAELSENGDSDFYKQKDLFAKKVLFKTEWVLGQAADYFGLVMGWQDRYGFNLGEYGSYELSDGFYIYIDAHHKAGSERWRPIKNSNGNVKIVQDEKNKNTINSYVVSGLRYNFENGGDLRFEHIYEQDAFSREEQDLVEGSFTSQDLGQQSLFKDNLTHFYNNNLHFSGQRFAMLSYTKPNFFDLNNFLIAIRDLYSMSDQSSRIYLNLEKNIGKQGTVFAYMMQNLGQKNSELNTLISAVYSLGYRQSF
jgi:hypothetical protein